MLHIVWQTVVEKIHAQRILRQGLYRGPRDYNATCDVLKWNDPRRVVQIPYNAIDAGYPSTDRALSSTDDGDLRWKSYSVAQ